MGKITLVAQWPSDQPARPIARPFLPDNALVLSVDHPAGDPPHRNSPGTPVGSTIRNSLEPAAVQSVTTAST